MDEDAGLAVVVDASFEEAVTRARVSLRSHNFSIISEMDAPASLGHSGRAHLFMCVWEQLLATGNLGGPGLDLGDHLTLNVVVAEEAGEVVVAALDPAEGMEGWGAAGVGAQEAHTALVQALEATQLPGRFVPQIQLPPNR